MDHTFTKKGEFENQELTYYSLLCSFTFEANPQKMSKDMLIQDIR